MSVSVQDLEHSKASLEAQLKELDATASRIMESAKREIPGVLQGWMDRLVQQQGYSVIEQMTDADLQRLRSEFDDLVARIPDLVVETFPPVQDWWHHHTGNDSAVDPVLKDKGGLQEPRATLAVIFGELGGVLMSSDLQSVCSRDWRVEGKRWALNMAIGWPEDLQMLLADYVKAYSNMFRTRAQLQEQSKILSQGGALNRWRQSQRPK